MALSKNRTNAERIIPKAPHSTLRHHAVSPEHNGSCLHVTVVSDLTARKVCIGSRTSGITYKVNDVYLRRRRCFCEITTMLEAMVTDEDAGFWKSGIFGYLDVTRHDHEYADA